MRWGDDNEMEVVHFLVALTKPLRIRELGALSRAHNVQSLPFP